MSDRRPLHEPFVPPPPSERSTAVLRLIFGILGLVTFAGVWSITDTLGWPWRIALAVLVAAPFLVLPDLLRDKSKAPAGFRPRKWEDEDKEH